MNREEFVKHLNATSWAVHGIDYNAVLASYDALVAERDRLRDKILWKEWVCESCNVVHPFKVLVKKGIGFNCPKCDNPCVPKDILDRQRLQQQIAELQAEVEKYRKDLVSAATGYTKDMDELQQQLAAAEAKLREIAELVNETIAPLDAIGEVDMSRDWPRIPVWVPVFNAIYDLPKKIHRIATGEAGK